MQKFTEELVDSYANKLLIGLSKEENEMVLKEFNIIEKNMELIANIPGIEKVLPMNYAIEDLTCELREDVAEDTLEIEDALANCGDYVDREVSVLRVVDKNE